MSNEEWSELLAQVDAMVAEMEELPDVKARLKVFQLLAGIDAIHREALRRLVRLFKEGVLEKVVTDPAIHTLMELYDLLPAADATTAVEAPAADAAPRFAGIPIKVIARGATASASGGGYPHWVPVLSSGDDVAPGAVRDIAPEGVAMLLCRVGERLFVVDAQCYENDASMSGARLDSFTLVCPAHAGCLYDVRQGTRIGRRGEVTCYPVKREEGGRVMVGINMPFKPELPAF